MKTIKVGSTDWVILEEMVLRLGEEAVGDAMDRIIEADEMDGLKELANF